MLLSVSDNIDQVRKSLTQVEQQQLPFAISRALNDTLDQVKTGFQQEMQRKLNRPTPYTLNSLQVKQSRKTQLFGTVQFREFGGLPAWKYLQFQVMGGARALKRHEKALIANHYMLASEYAIPGLAARIDQYGNMTGGQIKQILSALGSSSDPMQNTTDRSRKRNRAVAAYFAADRVTGGKLKPGIYQRQGKRAIRPVLRFVSKRPTYSKRLDWYGTGRTVSERAFPLNLQRRLSEALASAR